MSDTCEAMTKAVDATSAAAEKLAHTVQTMAPDAWEVLIRQQYVSAITQACAIAFACVFVVLLRRALLRSETAKTDEEFVVAVNAGGIVLAAILALVVELASVEIVGKLTNPQYYAAKELVEAIK